jgi:hypothetical protein
MFVKKFYTVLNQEPTKLHVPTATPICKDYLTRLRNSTQNNRR